MDKKDIERFRKRLLAEKAELERELASVGTRDASSAGGWDATSAGLDIDKADDNEVADKFEELEENTGIAANLEKQLTDVKDALARIEKGTYGLDENTGKPIGLKRLEANPSARTAVNSK